VVRLRIGAKHSFSTPPENPRAAPLWVCCVVACRRLEGMGPVQDRMRRFLDPPMLFDASLANLSPPSTSPPHGHVLRDSSLRSSLIGVYDTQRSGRRTGGGLGVGEVLAADHQAVVLEWGAPQGAVRDEPLRRARRCEREVMD